MSALVNILDYAHELVAIGVSEQEANIHARKLACIIDNTVASKEDLKAIHDHIKKIRLEINSEIAELKKDIIEIKSDRVSMKLEASEEKSDIAGITSEINELKSDVVKLKSEVGGLKSEIILIKSGFHLFEVKVISLESSIRQLGSKISDLETHLKDKIADFDNQFEARFARMHLKLNIIFVLTLIISVFSIYAVLH